MAPRAVGKEAIKLTGCDPSSPHNQKIKGLGAAETQRANEVVSKRLKNDSSSISQPLGHDNECGNSPGASFLISFRIFNNKSEKQLLSPKRTRKANSG
ncbi:hypothetical protein TNCV_1769681 [Trichonephila clavipes]|nr:hypothetical protein TNCV_1769681 [Trichonephila clavipes]